MIAACSSDGSSESSSGGAGGSSSSSGGSGGSSSVSSSKSSSGGSSTASSGGSSSSSKSSSSQAGGGGKGGGGAGGGGKGGGGAGGGGKGGGGAGGKGGSVSTGDTGGSEGGSTGDSSGAGGTGGKAGAGGTGTGGGTSTGGSTGGSTESNEPAVYISTNGSCVSGTEIKWTPGALKESTGNATVNIDGSKTKQNWEGFGGTFNELGWEYLQKLSETDRARAMQLLFSKDGTRFTIGRIPMGASDYGKDRYTCNENAEDLEMEKFSLERDKKSLIPYIKAAMEVNPDIKFWASPWTPPTWMKVAPYVAETDDNKETTSHFDSGNMSDKDTHLAAYAKYFVKFINGYKAENIKISMVAPQNEPGYTLHYPSCKWSSAVYSKFVGQHLGPALKDSGVDIMLGTLSNQPYDVTLANASLNDSSAKGYFKVVGVQWNVLEELYKGTKIGNLPVWATEHKCGNYPWNPEGFPQYNSSQAPNDQAYGVESWGYIRDAINKAGVTAYNAWNMVLDKGGNGIDTRRQWNQDTLLVADGSLKVTPAYCVFRHFSQFVEPGAKVLDVSGETVAFKNSDGTLVAVMYSAQAKDPFVVSMGGKKFEFKMPAGGWATVKVKP